MSLLALKTPSGHTLHSHLGILAKYMYLLTLFHHKIPLNYQNGI